MGVNQDCRHYIMQTVRSGDRTERCKLGAAKAIPFACPDGCVFYEPRKTSSAGWQVAQPRPTGDDPRDR